MKHIQLIDWNYALFSNHGELFPSLLITDSKGIYYIIIFLKKPSEMFLLGQFYMTPFTPQFLQSSLKLISWWSFLLASQCLNKVCDTFPGNAQEPTKQCNSRNVLLKLQPGLFVVKQNKNKTNLQIGAFLIGIASLATKPEFLLHCNSGVVKSLLTYCNGVHFLNVSHHSSWQQQWVKWEWRAICCAFIKHIFQASRNWNTLWGWLHSCHQFHFTGITKTSSTFSSHRREKQRI